MNAEIFQKRRNCLVNNLEKDEIVIIFANDPISGSGTGAFRFLQNSNFYYFTGLDTPEAVLVMGKNGDTFFDTVFVEKNIPERIVWDGEKMYPEEVTQISGIKNVQFLEGFDSYISYQLFRCEKAYINIGLQDWKKPLSKQALFAERMKKIIPSLTVKDVDLLIKPLRNIKDETEIEAITEAIRVTWAGIEGIWEIAQPGMMEYELEAKLRYEMERRACTYGFLPIIGAGKNAATLHYINNNSKVGENELVLLDVGASYKHYSADIARTFPVSGKFTDRQREVYAEVLFIQKEVISMMKPGVAMNDVFKKTRELMFESLKKLNLIQEESEVNQYFMHGIGHHLGLDVHDLGDRDFILQEGMVTTIEPGIYIPEESIGVRIEDDILITSDGHRILSDFIPKEIEDIERILAEKKRK
ncbi:MAG TPA: Xaa-Pro aminopeptidase [Candidatus Cloacimonadota bacterium]|nr:Xaa-Pro aminopeptidase [Candidatus Cloacimonadota bacterium]